MSVYTFWRREMRTGSLQLLLLALALAVASVSSVGIFAERLELAMSNDAKQLLGGDVVAVSDRGIPPEWVAKAEQLGLAHTQTVGFPSMAIAGEQSQLVSIKSVASGYPLRGRLRVADARAGTDTLTTDIPRPGQVWADEAALAALSIDVGQTMQLGDKTMTVGKIITVEPDRGVAFVNFAPRVMLNGADLQATGLLQPGSRATYRLLLAGSPPATKAFDEWVRPQLKPGQRLDNLQGGRPEISATLERAEKFLSLASLLGTLIAAVGVALVSHHFARNKSPEIALLKSLGYTPGQLRLIWFQGLLALAIAGSTLGAVLGWCAHWGLVMLLGSLVGVALPMAGLQSVGLAMVVGVVLMVGFALAPVMSALATPPIKVLRQELEPVRPAGLWVWSTGVLAAAVLCIIAAKDIKLAGIVLAGAVGAVALFAAVAWLTIRIGLKAFERLSQTTQGGGLSFRFAWMSLSRRTGSTVLQGVALTLGLTSLLLLSVVKGDLIEGWQKAIPADAPNRFALNIQPEQVSEFEHTLRSMHVSDAALYPMVRGRLVAVNERSVDADSFENERAKRLVDREFNLSYGDQLPAHNRLSGGRWFAESSHAGVPEISIEEGIANTLGLKLGDQLTFDVAGQIIKAPITSLRALNWDSMKVNFYVIFPSTALKDFPHSWITAFHLPAASSLQGRRIIKQFPNVTLVDTGSVIRQIRGILDQVASAVQFIFSFTVLAGALVLFAAMMSGAQVRTREAAVMRALGASRSQLRRSLWLELVLIGVLAGGLSAITAQVVGYVIARTVFDFTYVVSPWIVVGGVGLGVFTAVLAGSWSVRVITNSPPLQVLRDIQ